MKFNEGEVMKLSVIVRIFLCLVLAPFAAHAVPKTAGGPGGVGTTDGTSKLIVWLQPDNIATNGQPAGDASPSEPWSDSSGNANHFDYFDDSKVPQWTNSAINGQAAVAFDGTDTVRMPAGGLYTDTDAETVFVVHDRDSNASHDAVLGDQSYNNSTYALYHKTDGWNWLMYGGGGGASVRDAGHGVTTDGLQMIVGVSSIQLGTIALYDQGGLLKSSSFTTPTPNRRYDLADTGSQALDGLIAEFVAFQTNLNTVQRYLVENYLCSKYDMTLTGRDFYAGDTAGNGDYDADVCGVGQDGSTQVDNGGMSGFGIEATSGLDDGDWVLAGNNLEFDNNRVTADVPAGLTQRWQRVWYLDKTGNVNVTLAFDHSESLLSAPAGGTDFALLYSATKDPYSFAALAIVESVSGDTVSFAVPDANLQDGYYTLASDEGIPVVFPKTSGGPGGVGTTDGTSKLIVWLKPDNTAINGQIVGVLSPAAPWSDNSGNANHFDYFSASQRPQWTNPAINGQAAVDFDGTDTLRMPAGGAYAETDAETVFVVHDRDDNATEDAVLGCQNHNNNVYALYHKTDGWNWLMSGGSGGQSVRDAGHGVTTDGLQMIVGVSSIQLGSIALYDQGGLLKSSSFTTPSPSSRRYDLADTGSQALDGQIAEFVAFQTNLNTVQRYLVENYLCSLYDMTLTGRDFYAGDTAGNGDYDADVCGVGRLDVSTQVDNGGMSGFGIEVTSGMDDNEWVLAGHNLQFENRRVTTDVPAGMQRRWQRVWYLDKTGNMNVTLAFDHSESLLSAPAGGTDFELLYSATKNPYNFAAVATDVESVSGDTVSFAVPAANLQDGYYTLASDEDIPAVSEVTGGTGPGGLGTSKLVVWLKPDNFATGGTEVNPWSDSSGNANDFDYFNSSQRPNWANNAINGQTAVDFDGVAGDTLRMPAGGAYADTDAETVFVVHDRDSNASHDAVLGCQNHNNNIYALYHKTDGWNWLMSGGSGGQSVRDAGHGVTTDGLQMIVGVSSLNLGSIALYDQGGLLKSSSFTTPSPSSRRYDLADTGSQALDGLIAEFVAFKTNLTTVQRYLVENYLCSEFDMTLTDRDFYAGDTAGNGDYDFDVFGIGRLSSSDEVTAAGLEGLGIAAPWGLSDNQWTLAGHKVTNNVFVSLEGQNAASLRWARVWYIDVTGTLDARLSFDFSDAGLAQQGSGYVLLYSAVNAFSWSTVDDADASVDGDRLHFDVPAASMVDGYYTTGFIAAEGTLMFLR